MTSLQDIKDQWDELDDLDKQKVYIGLGFLVLIFYLFYTVSNAANTVGTVLGGGLSYANESASNLANLNLTK